MGNGKYSTMLRLQRSLWVGSCPESLKCGAGEIQLHFPSVALFLELSRRPPLRPPWHQAGVATHQPPGCAQSRTPPHPAAPAAFREKVIHNSISFEKGLDCYCHNGRGARPHPRPAQESSGAKPAGRSGRPSSLGHGSCTAGPSRGGGRGPALGPGLLVCVLGL